MANIYLKTFQDAINQKSDFTTALIQAITLYLEKNADTLAANAALKDVLAQFITHAKMTQIGNVILGYHFKENLPPDLQQLMRIAKMIEESIILSPSPLVSDCENKAAAEGHSPKIIFEMCAHLERALKDEVVPAYHQREVEMRRQTWEILLYEKFADLILMAKDVDDLYALFEANFSSELAKDLQNLRNLREELLAQIEYLNDKEFLPTFFAFAKMADRFDHVQRFYLEQKEGGFVTPELKASLSKLFFQIINKAYAPCDVEKFKLMCDPQASIEEVYSKLKELLKKKDWKTHAGTDLEVELVDKLQTDESKAKDWEEVAFRFTAKRLPAYQVHCVKYAGDPSKDPKELLRALPSPVKAKSRPGMQIIPIVPLPQQPISLEAVDLRTDEVLEDEFGDQSNKLEDRKAKMGRYT